MSDIFIDASHAGYGKTKNIKNVILKDMNENPYRINLIITTSIENCKEKEDYFSKIRKSNVVCITSEDTDGSVVNEVSDTIDSIIQNNTKYSIIIITNQTYNILKQRGVLNNITYNCYFDEVPNTCYTIPVNVGKITQENILPYISTKLVTEHFAAVETNSITHFNTILKEKDTMGDTLKNLSTALVNDNFYEVFVKHGSLTKIEQNKNFYNNVVEFHTIIKKEMYEGADKTYIFAARFYDTMFYKMFLNSFKFIDISPKNSYKHKNSDRLTINYISEKDITRYANDEIDDIFETKNVNVIFNSLTEKLKNEPHTIFTNTYRLKEQRKFCNKNTNLSNTNVVGLNNFIEYTHTAFLATFNPSTNDVLFAEEMFDMKYEDLKITRLYTVYQCMFRDNLRDVNSKKLVNWYIFDRFTANYLANCFDQSPEIKKLDDLNEIYNNGKISEEVRESKNIIVVSNRRKCIKKSIMTINNTVVKTDNVLGELISNKDSLISISNKDINHMIFEVPVESNDEFLFKLQENKLNYYTQQSSIGSKSIKYVVELNKTINNDIYEHLGNYFIDTIFKDDNIKLLPTDTVICTSNVKNRKTVINGNKLPVRETLQNRQFGNYVAMSIQYIVDSSTDNIFKLFDITLLDISLQKNAVKNIQQISGKTRNNVFTKLKKLHKDHCFKKLEKLI